MISNIIFAKPNRYVIVGLFSLICCCLGISTHAQTTLHPGDVYVSMLTADVSGGNKIEGHVGFVLLVDVEAGTTITFRKDLWICDDADVCGWAETNSPQLMTWTAPEGGLERGTEVIIVDTGGDMEPRQEDVNGWATTSGGPGGNNGLDVLIDGDVCGTVEGTAGNYDGSYLWVYQTRNNVPHHLYLTGYNIDYAGNTAQGTDLYDENELANCNPVFAFEYFNTVWQWSLKAAFRNSFAVTPGIYGLFGAERGDLANGGAFLVGSDYTMYDYTNSLGATLIQNLGNVNFPPSAVNVAWSAVNTNNGGADYTGSNSEDIVVANSTSKYVIDASAEVQCRDVKIYSGTFQSCDGNARSVRSTRNFSMVEGESNNMYNSGLGKLTMGGTAASQTIDLGNYSNPSSTKAKFYDLVLDNSNGVTLKGHGRLKGGGSLDFTSGTLTVLDDPDGSGGTSGLTFESNATMGTASIGPCSAANFGDGASQEFTFQRYIPADPDGSSWVNIGAYVTGTTVADWTASNPNMLIFEYDETNWGSMNAGWTYLWDGTAELVPGSGYMAMIPQAEDALISIKGPFKMGDVPINLTFTDDPNQSNETVDGWNLVSNPYPSPVNLVQVLSRVDGVEAYWIFDNTGDGAYVTKNDQGTGDAPETLDIGQSFWVKVSSNQTLTFTEADKVAVANSFIREYDPGFQGSVGIEISNDDAQWCRSFVQFMEGSTPGFDEHEDAQFLNSTDTDDLRIWTTAETGEKLSIQSLGSLAETSSVPLTITTGNGGLVKFGGYNQEHDLSNVCAIVEDLETGMTAQIGVDHLELELPPNTLIEDRFVLHFSAAPTMSWENTACDGLAVELSEGDWSNWSASWYAIDDAASGEGFPEDLSDGEYIFELAQSASGCVQAFDVLIETACLGDFNLNGERDIVDLLVILAGLPGGAFENGFNEEADCDCDGAVTVNDMLTFLTVFSTPCE